MADIEKVVKGLEIHANGCGHISSICHEERCPYRKGPVSCDIEQMCLDAIELLKPRLLTLEEAYAAEIVWYESRCVYDSAWGKLSPGDTKVSTAITRLGHNGWAYEDDRDYGSAWRCWSKRPSDEQRKATKWK